MKQKNKKTSLKMPLYMKSIKRALLVVLLALCARMGASAEEFFDKVIVEAFSDTVNRVGFHNAGVDINGDGLADIFISIPYIDRNTFYRRLANFLKEGTKVSFDDKRKLFSTYSGFYTVESNSLLEINGRSILQIFPGEDIEFPLESARQQRLNSGR